FGPQRFGRDGANLRRALDWARGGEAPRDRQQCGFVLSAARSFLFNEVLVERVRRGDWNRLLPGEAAMLDGRRSFFHAAQVDATLAQRCAAMDVHPSGPLPGRGESPATDAALDVERRALAAHDALVALLVAERMEYERRSLRLPVCEFSWVFEADDVLMLRFVLPRGAFATAVLHEFLADAWDAGEE
ncbi:MAG TPA: tRNA pseudouridine(13) synthase TruD, partial [Steroidobacteraceae bacterium]|nr:tRNA pseudouridine(13) synthase TruD [Steroidobacteraceae bacterium]